MKKILAVLSLAFASITTVHAEPYAAVEYETAENRNTNADSYSTGVILGYKQGDWQYSGKLSTSQAKWGEGNITTGYEGRIKRKFSVLGTKPYLQGRLGEKLSSTSDFAYYALDAGIVIPVVDKFSVDFSYRYRDAFNTANNFQTDRYGIEGMYDITPADRLGLRYSQSYGDSETDAWRFQYQHSF